MNTSIFLTNTTLTGDILVTVGDESVILNASRRRMEFDVESETEIAVEYLCERRTLSYECKKIRNPICRFFWWLFGGLFGLIIGGFNFLYDDKMKVPRIYNLLRTVDPFDIKQNFTVNGGEEIKLTVRKPRCDAEKQAYFPVEITVDGTENKKTELNYCSKYYKSEVMPPFICFFAVILFLLGGICRIPISYFIIYIKEYESLGNLGGIILMALISIACLALFGYAVLLMRKYYKAVKAVDANTRGDESNEKEI